MKRRIAAVAALLIATPLAACDGGEVTTASGTTSSSSSSSSSQSSSTGSSTPAQSGTTASASASAPATSESSSSSSEGSGSDTKTLKFGDTVTFKNGVKVTVSKPAAYTPGEYSSAKDKWPKFAKFTFTMVNGSGKPVKASSLTTKATAGTTETDSVYGDGLGEPYSTVLPGKTIVWAEAFGYKAGDELILEVGQYWDFDDDTTGYFVGKP